MGAEALKAAQLLTVHFRAQQQDARAFLLPVPAQLLLRVGRFPGMDVTDEQLQPHPAAFQLDAFCQLCKERGILNHHAVGLVDDHPHMLALPAGVPAGLVSHFPCDFQNLLLNRFADSPASVQRIADRGWRNLRALGDIPQSQFHDNSPFPRIISSYESHYTQSTLPRQTQSFAALRAHERRMLFPCCPGCPMDFFH